jgi:uncharacterized damage-inducible protein DinB
VCAVRAQASEKAEETIMVAITGEELQEWVENMSEGWHKFITQHPEILVFPCDIRETSTVAQLLQHIVAVELRYAERLNELPQTEYSGIPYDSVEALYATHDRAMELLRPLMDRGEAFWETVLEMKTRSAGILRASRRTVLVHMLTHSVRHYAQLATLVRNHGVPSGQDMDYILLRLVPAPVNG